MKYTKLGNSDLNVSRIRLQESWRRTNRLQRRKSTCGPQEIRR